MFISPGKLKLFGGFVFATGVEWIETVFLGPLGEKESLFWTLSGNGGTNERRKIFKEKR
jgi:hypothetical protein